MVTLRCRDKTFSEIQAIIFDKDGTLEDSRTFLRELGQRRARLIDAQVPGVGDPLLLAFGIEDATLAPAGLMAVGSRYENEIAAAAYIAETGKSWFESLTIARGCFAEADRHLTAAAGTSPLFTGCLEVLKALSEAGLKLGILSADSSQAVHAFVERHQLSPYIQFAMGVEGSVSKDAFLYLQACQALGVEPGATLMVGDSAVDIDMAYQAGAAGAIGICWETPEAAHLEKADVAIAQLDEIKILSS